MGVCTFPSSWMWFFATVGLVFALLTASTLIFRHRHLRFTATVTLIFGLGIFFAAVLGPIYAQVTIGDTRGIDTVVNARMRLAAFRRCFGDGGSGCVIPITLGVIGVMVARVGRRREAAPTPIPRRVPPS